MNLPHFIERCFLHLIPLSRDPPETALVYRLKTVARLGLVLNEAILSGCWLVLAHFWNMLFGSCISLDFDTFLVCGLLRRSLRLGLLFFLLLGMIFLSF